MVEPDGAVLAAGVPGGLELPVGQLGRAVLPADQLPAILVQCFFILRDVSCHAAQRTGGLLFVLDEVDGGHQRCSSMVSPRRTSRIFPMLASTTNWLMLRPMPLSS